MGGPLSHLRVVDLTDDVGRFATKLLVEAGAAVVRVHDGSGVTGGPPMRSPAAAARGGLLDWWYDGGKRIVPLDLASPEGAEAYRRLAAQADLVVESSAPGHLGALGLDHGDLVAANPSLVQVSVTPFGRTGPRAAWTASDLVAQAMGGVLSLSGTPEQALVPWGRQGFAFGSFTAAIAGLAAVGVAATTGRGQHVDVSVQESIAAAIEQLWFEYWYDDVLALPKLAARQGSLHWLRAYLVTACRTGHAMVSPTPTPTHLLDWMVEDGVEGAAERAEMDLAAALADIDGLMEVVTRFAARHDAHELFVEAQRRHIAFGEVQTVAQVVENPQFAYRGFFPDIDAGDGTAVHRPRLPVLFAGTPAPPPAAPEPASLAEVLAAWGGPRRAAGSAPVPARPLEGVRVLDFTWVLAGPFCCRMLGDLGADIVKVQTAGRATLVNEPSFPYYPCWNRSKRSLALDVKAPGALDVLRRLVEQSDVLIENFSAGVLDRWGLSYEAVRSWNPGLVYVTMSGCGHEGPWKDMITYAPTVHALCGLTHLTNPPGRGDIGVGFSLNDHAAGFTGAFAVLAALEARRRTGEGQHVDIAQLEVGSYLVGAALTDLLANGREAQPAGNPDPYAPFLVDDVFTTVDGEVAVTVREDQAGALGAATGGSATEVAGWCAARTAEEAMTQLQGHGIAAGRVQHAGHLAEDPQLAARAYFGTMHSDVFGDRPFERFPARFGLHDLAPYRPAPNYLGEHAFEILAELCGMDDEAVAVAMAEGLLG